MSMLRGCWIPDDIRPEQSKKIIFELKDEEGTYCGKYFNTNNGEIWMDNKETVNWESVDRWVYYPEKERTA